MQNADKGAACERVICAMCIKTQAEEPKAALTCSSKFT